MNPVLNGILLVALSTVFDGGSQICMKKAALKKPAAWLWIAGAVAFSIVEAVIYTFALQILSVGIAFAIGEQPAMRLQGCGLLRHRSTPSAIDTAATG